MRMRRQHLAITLIGLALALLNAHFVMKAVQARDSVRSSERIVRKALLDNSGNKAIVLGLSSSSELAGSRYWQAYQAAATAAHTASASTDPNPIGALGELADAEGLLDAPAHHGPNSIRSKALNLLGLIELLDASMRTGDPKEINRLNWDAVSNFQRAVYRDPSNSDAKTNLELALQLTKKDQKPKPKKKQQQRQNSQPNSNKSKPIGAAIPKHVSGGY